MSKDNLQIIFVTSITPQFCFETVWNKEKNYKGEDEALMAIIPMLVSTSMHQRGQSSSRWGPHSTLRWKENGKHCKWAKHKWNTVRLKYDDT